MSDCYNGNMKDMFKECKELSLDSSFDTEEVLLSDMKDMFKECKELSLDSSFDTEDVLYHNIINITFNVIKNKYLNPIKNNLMY